MSHPSELDTPPGEEALGAAVPAPSPHGDRMGRLRSFARALDTAARIPGTDIRFGLDALLGLIPGAGDVAGGLASGYILVEGARLGASRATLLRMLGNILLEVFVGAVPVVGDLFDVAWKANRRNVELLEAHLARRAREGRSYPEVGVTFVWLLAGVLLVAITLVTAVMIGFLRMIF